MKRQRPSVRRPRQTPRLPWVLVEMGYGEGRDATNPMIAKPLNVPKINGAIYFEVPSVDPKKDVVNPNFIITPPVIFHFGQGVVKFN
jgi:hypothetical protein